MTNDLRVIVYHSGYGCETGCCGHAVALVRPDGTEAECNFVFGHPGGDQVIKAWVERQVTEKFGAEHVADLDWDHCIITNIDDCPM